MPLCKLIKCPLAGRGNARSVSQFGVPIPFRVPAGAQIYDPLVPRRAHRSRGEVGAASRLGEEGALVCLIRYAGDSSNAATCVFDVVLHAISKALEARSKSKQAPPVLRPSWRVSKTRVLKSIISMFSGQCGQRKHWCVCVCEEFFCSWCLCM